MAVHEGLREGLLRNSESRGAAGALSVGGRCITYGDLRATAETWAAALDRAHTSPVGLTAVLAHRSETAYAGVLATLLRGHGYCPLHPGYPVARLADMLERSRATALIVGAEAMSGLPELLERAALPLVVLAPDGGGLVDLRRRFPRHTLLGPTDLDSASTWRRSPVAPDDVAYLLFTSGSTGTPKGVLVTHANAAHFLAAAQKRYTFTPADRFSQTFDLTFDLSVFDLFATWGAGGTLCVPSVQEMMTPGAYINAAELTVWFSVPSAAAMMKRFRQLRPDRYRTLRWSLFCGEGLPLELAEAWAAAAPASQVENLYGPTELTIACTAHRFTAADRQHARHGLVPIGNLLPGMSAKLVDKQLQEVTPDAPGELLVTGPQVTRGYLNDPTRTAERFVQLGAFTYYRTGDRVERLPGTDTLVFLGRLDNQVKVRGYRVELGEVEAALRRCDGVTQAAAILSSDGQSLLGFVTGADLEAERIASQLSAILPHYMQPVVVPVPAMPLNGNGKVDRKALLSQCPSRPN